MRSTNDADLRALRLAALAGRTTQTLCRNDRDTYWVFFKAVAVRLGSTRFWAHHDPSEFNNKIGYICRIETIHPAAARFLFMVRSMLSSDNIFGMLQNAVQLCRQSPTVLYAVAGFVKTQTSMEWGLRHATNVRCMSLRAVFILAHYPKTSMQVVVLLIHNIRQQRRFIATTEQIPMIRLLSHLSPHT